MATIDIEALLAPQSDDEPCGPDLEQDQAFSALQVAAKGKEARESGKKGVVKPAEEPKWSEVADQAISLLGDMKHLAVAVNLTRAATNLDGMRGTADGLTLIYSLLDKYWEHVYPLLDEDDGDAMVRMNSLLPLDAHGMLVKDVSAAPIVRVKALGEFSMRSIRLSNGEIEAKAEEEVPDSTHIDAAFKGAELDELQAEFDALEEAIAATDKLESFLDDKVGSADAPSLGNLKGELQSVAGVLSEQLERRGVEVKPVGGGGGTEPPPTVPGQIGSRQDAILALDRVSEYFRQNEPSSPVPLLLERAKRLISKDFMEILQDLTPGGVDQARLIGGLDED